MIRSMPSSKGAHKVKKPRSNIRWKPAGTGTRNGKRVKRRDRTYIDLGVSFERYEYTQAMRGWPVD